MSNSYAQPLMFENLLRKSSKYIIINNNKIIRSTLFSVKTRHKITFFNCLTKGNDFKLLFEGIGRFTLCFVT